MQRMTGGRLPHALLVTGENGVGKRLFANALSGLLVCERPDMAGGAPVAVANSVNWCLPAPIRISVFIPRKNPG